VPSFTAASRSGAPLAPGWQLCEDTVVALGPAVAGISLAAALCRIGVIAPEWRLCADPLIAVPYAVIIWHLAASPAPVPPASAARRVLVRAAASLTLLLAAAAIAVSLAFSGRAGWVPDIFPAGCGLAPLLCARAAGRRNRVPAAAAGTVSAPA
jgi:hypothetical protein